jgi:hypothetical protein
MTSMFGPHGQQVLSLITSITGLSGDQVDEVVSAWKGGSARARTRAWAHLSRTTADDERYRILAAAALARREALEIARRMDRTDWAFWAAACDAGAAVAAGRAIGHHYDTLVGPFAQVLPALAPRLAAVPGSAGPDCDAAPGMPDHSDWSEAPRARLGNR